nr:MAG TPA: LRV protein FeS4 cluster [Caudoviricetes sp.]
MTTTVTHGYANLRSVNRESELLVLTLTQEELHVAREIYRAGRDALESAYIARDYTLHPEMKALGLSPKRSVVRVGKVGNLNVRRPPMGRYRRYAKKIDRFMAKDPERYAKKIQKMTIALRLAYIRGHIELGEG